MDDTIPEETDNNGRHEIDPAVDINAVIRDELDGVADELEAAGIDLDDEEAAKLDSAAMTLNGISEALATVRDTRERLGRPKPDVAQKTPTRSKGRYKGSATHSSTVASRTATSR